MASSPQPNQNPDKPLKPNLKPLNPNADPFIFPSCLPLYCPHPFYPQPPPPPVAVGWPAVPEFLYGSLYHYHPPFCYYNVQSQPQASLYKNGDDCTGVGGGDEKALGPQGVVRKKQEGLPSGKTLAKKREGFLRGKTTVMIRNIPNKLSRKDLLHILDEICGKENQQAVWSCDPVRSKYDFVYLPMDFEHRCNLGYAFVNFTSSNGATRVCKHLHKHKWIAYESKKICEIGCARIQGKEALVDHFRKSIFTCHTDDYLPVVLSPPRNGSIPRTPPRIVGKRAPAYTRKP